MVFLFLHGIVQWMLYEDWRLIFHLPPNPETERSPIMIGPAHSHFCLPALAAVAVAGLVQSGCSMRYPSSGDDLVKDKFTNTQPFYEQNADIRPTAVTSCLDDSPNPSAGCM
jgi:hypothetical protein